MQTAFACGQDFASRHLARGLSCPCDPDQPCADWMPETFRGSITTRGADPLPVDPYPTVRRLDARQGFRALHHDEGRGPCDPVAKPRGQHMTAASWYHCSVKPVSRSAGRSVVAAAAYRLGECLHDERYATVHDYTRRRGVECAFTVAPADAPEWAHNPEGLWNAAERAETRKNSTVAREVELALPSFLSAR